MARIPEAELERLKRDVSVEELARGRGVELRRAGKDLLGLCPFHEDHEPSLVITPGRNLWHCLGACQAGGTAIDWVMQAEGVSFRHAVELLRAGGVAGAGAVASGETGGTSAAGDEGRAPSSEARSEPRLSPVVEVDVEAEQQVLQVLGYYHETLKSSPEALGYLESRGIGSAEAIDRFRLGYSNRTLGYRLPGRSRGRVREALQQVGLIRKSGHEHFRGSLVIPVFDEEGRAVEVYGRKIGSGLRKGTPLHLYLPGPHRGVWNSAALRASEEVILCESLIDALTFWCAGYRNVTASYGVEGFTAEHVEVFRRAGIERVLIAYDRDEAGERAAAALAERLQSDERGGFECFRIRFPRGMDANDYALQVRPAPKSLGVLIRSAEWLGKGAPRSGPTTVGEGEDLAAALDLGDHAAGEEQEERTARTTSPDGERPAEAEPPAEPEPLPSLAAKEKTSEPTGAVPSGQPGPARQAAHEGEERAAEAEDAELVATPVPRLPRGPRVRAEQRGGEVVLSMGGRRWRVRGLEKNLSFDHLRVSVLVSAGEAFHVDVLDLYSARHRQGYVKAAAAELGLDEQVVKRELGLVLLELEELQQRSIEEALGKGGDGKGARAEVELSEEEKAAALELLESPDLLGRVLEDFERCGVVGEEENKLLGYLAAVSRKLDEPLAVVIQSSSAAGKSSLMDSVLSFLPPEEQVKYSAMTGQSLFYMGEGDLRHKVLAIVEEEGAERAAYALKLLQSEGELTIASTGKDPATGRLVTQEYRVEGPVAIVLTTTAVEIDEELLNRCVVLTVNEGREQTRAIHQLQRQRQTLEGLLARREGDAVRRTHQNAQRLLRPLLVANPYARQLTFVDEQTRTRRDHMKYLTLIRAIALLHQYQRPIREAEHRGARVPYIEVEPGDIEVANRLCHQVLGRSLDELSPQTRRLLEILDAHVGARCEEQALERSEYRFTRREAREVSGLGNTQVKLHMRRLEEMEYVLAHRGGRGQQYVYELVYEGEGQDGERFVPRLLDVSKLVPSAGATATPPTAGYDGDLSGVAEQKSPPGRPQVGAKSGGGRPPGRQVFQRNSGDKGPVNGRAVEIASEETTAEPSYVPIDRPARGRRPRASADAS